MLKKPRTTIEKWLHFDRNYTHKQVYIPLKITPNRYVFYLERPWGYTITEEGKETYTGFTIVQMEKMAYLLDKSITEVFWACYKKPYSEIHHDDKQLRVIAALERAGIR